MSTTARSMIQALRERRGRLVGQLEEINARAQREGRTQLSGAESSEFDSLLADIRNVDVRIIELEDGEARMATAAGAAMSTSGMGGSRIGGSFLTYRRGDGNSYFLDLVRRQVHGDHGAQERLARHRQEVARAAADLPVQFRDMTRTDGAGGDFVPPIYLIEDYAEMARAARVFADRMRPFPLPPGTDSINIPRVTTGGLTGFQTADNAAVAEQDMVTATVSLPVRTIAGQIDVAIQLLDQSPVNFDDVVFADLIADYNAQLDAGLINGSGAAGQVLGVLNTAGIIAVTYTDATPSVPELYPKGADAMNQVATQRKLPPEAWVMHPRRWTWMLAALDGQNRPLVVPEQSGPFNAAGVAAGTFNPELPVGRWHSLPVFIDANIPTNLGAGTNEDRIFALRGVDHFLFESFIRTRVLADVLSANLEVRLQIYGYVAFTAGRFPVSSAVVSGTGLVTPTF